MTPEDKQRSAEQRAAEIAKRRADFNATSPPATDKIRQYNSQAGFTTNAYSFERFALLRLPHTTPFSPGLMRVTHAHPLNPAALAFVPFGVVLVRVRVRVPQLLVALKSARRLAISGARCSAKRCLSSGVTLVCRLLVVARRAYQV